MKNFLGKCTILVVSGLFLIVSAWPVQAGAPESAQYSADTDRIFWFIQISDIHVGAPGSEDTDYLHWMVTEGVDVIDPEFIVASGDLTDSTNGGSIPSGPYRDEWIAYHDILTDAGMTPGFYFDIPGNHDHYDDQTFAYYLNNSIQGLAAGSTQVSWTRNFAFGAYHFLAVNTAGNDGSSFSILPPNFGDNAGLDADELTFIEDELTARQDADLTIIFGHHPLPQRPTGIDSDTYISYGQNEFTNLMETYGVSMYAYGHTHQYRQGLLETPDSPGVFDLNIAPLGKDPAGTYQLTAIDCNGIATAQQPAAVWPAVLITVPVDVKLGVEENPYAYSVNELNPKPVRALVFDEIPVTNVQFRVDGGAWRPMTHVNGPLWNALWNEPEVLDEEHTLEVQATGSTIRSHTITIGVAETTPPPSGGNNGGGGGGGGCFIGSLGKNIFCAAEDNEDQDSVRKEVQEKFPEQSNRIMKSFGLKAYAGENIARKNNGNPTVILVHGLDEPGAIWMNLAPALHENGFEVWTLNYPNDQPVRESAKFFLDQILSSQTLLNPDLAIVAHSMGGLVAREMLTSPSLHYQDLADKAGFPRVKYLIMVGTPNHGSFMAHFRIFAELREQVIHMVEGEYHWLLPILDGAGEAGEDLLPGSEFLEALNSRKNPENIKMLVIAGKMTSLQKDDSREMIQKLAVKLSPDRKEFFDNVADEVNPLFNEIGDGAVSLESAKLSGVPMETVSGNHLSILRNFTTGSKRIPPAIPVIVKCLSQGG